MKKFFLSFATCLLSLVPFLASASTGQIDFTNSVPDLASSNLVPKGDFIGWVQNFYQFSLIAGVFLAVGVITWAGLRYALGAGNPTTQSDARDQILQAILGLTLLFGAYLVLYTIDPELTRLKLPTLTSVSVPAPTGVGPTFTPATGGLTDAQVRQAFGGQNIQIKEGAGAARVAGLQQSIVNAVLDLRASCTSCEIVVTEGTAGVHRPGTYSHANGYKVDLRLNDGLNNLNNYITNNFTYIGIRSDDGAPQWRAPNGAIYAKESNHWDVVVRS